MTGSPIFAAAVEEWRDVRDDYARHLEQQFVKAEQACRGNLLNQRGREARVDAFSLFSGNRLRAHAYASEELLTFWETTPRMTFAEFERQATHAHTCATCGSEVRS